MSTEPPPPSQPRRKRVYEEIFSLPVEYAEDEEDLLPEDNTPVPETPAAFWVEEEDEGSYSEEEPDPTAANEDRSPSPSPSLDLPADKVEEEDTKPSNDDQEDKASEAETEVRAEISEDLDETTSDTKEESQGSNLSEPPPATQITHKLSESAPHIPDTFKMMSKKDAAKEISGHIVGPMPADLFLSDFMPGKANVQPSPARFQDVSTASREDGMYKPWITALEAIGGKKLAFVDTHDDRIKDQDGALFGPDVTAYVYKRGLAFPTRCDLERAEVLQEFKFDHNDDPFDDDLEGFERAADSAKATLGQITLSAIAQLSCQFRTHVFSLLIFRHYARILRWDRGGVVVTQKINFTTHDNIITTFFKRLASAKASIRGVDESVTAPTVKKSRLPYIRSALNANQDVELYQVRINGRRFIIADYTFFSASSLFGRATRCYRAFNVDPASIKEKRLCNLKDTWRIWTPNRLNEYQVLIRLRDAKVRNIPVALCGEDVLHGVPNHRTRTQDYQEEGWAMSKVELRTFQHFRLVTEQLDLHLGECKTIQHAVTVVRDATIAHEDAFEKAGMIHRDVSWANIMARLLKDGTIQGVLLDWDLAQEADVKKLSKDKREQGLERTGTWYFIAARLISNVGLPIRQNRLDDIESFFHVLIYLAALFTDHELGSTQKLGLFFHNYFREVIESDGKHAGGSYKITFMRADGDDLLTSLTHEPLKHLLEHLCSVLKARYPRPARKGIFVKARPGASDDEKTVKEVENNPTWLSGVLTEALGGYSQAEWDERGTFVVQKPIPVSDIGKAHHQSISSIAMRNVSVRGQQYIDGIICVPQKEVEEQKDDDGHTEKKRKLT